MVFYKKISRNLRIFFKFLKNFFENLDNDLSVVMEVWLSSISENGVISYWNIEGIGYCLSDFIVVMLVKKAF